MTQLCLPLLAWAVPDHITSPIKLLALCSATVSVATSKNSFTPPASAHQWLTQHQWIASNNQAHIGSVNHKDKKDIICVGRLGVVHAGMAKPPPPPLQAVKAYSQSCWASLGSSLATYTRMFAYWNCTLTSNQAYLHTFAQQQSFLESLLQAALLSFSKASVWVVLS